MATKIINVLKDDRFEDILRLFQAASAQEVIFVMPTKSKFLNDEGHFTVLSAAAEEQGKNILILSSNSKVTELALKYNFGILSNGKNEKKPPKVKVVAQAAEDDEEEEVAEDQVENSETDEAGDFDTMPQQDEEVQAEPVYGTDREAEADTGNFAVQEEDTVEAELTAARLNKTLEDIIKPKEEEQVSVRISKKNERPLKLDVRKDVVPPIDIRPPVIQDKMMDQIQSVWQGKKESWSQQTEKKPLKPQTMPKIVAPGTSRFAKFSLHKKMVSLLGGAALILFGIVIYVSTGSAQITLKPRVNPLDISMKVSASDTYQEVDSDLRRIPGQLFSINKTIEESFPATGERDVVQKARGRITVYNEYGTTPQVLIATTRFESEGGLIFRTLTTVTVPGTKVANGKITAGTVEVEVIADKAGDTYNIAAGKFTIPAFKEKGDMDRYQKFYGMSKDAFKGGIIGKAKVVTEQDYADAKKKMEERIVTEAADELRQQTAGLKILTPPQPEMEEIKSDAQIDEAIDSFTMTASAKIQTVGFKESDLYLLISQYIEKANDLMIIPEKLKLEFQSVQFDKETNRLEFVMLVKGPAFGKINENKIIADLAGKNEGEITEYIKGVETIVSARVLLSPFWVRKVPTNKDKVKLIINYD